MTEKDGCNQCAECSDKGIGFEIRSVSNLIKRYLDSALLEYGETEATLAHGWIIGYLYERRDRDVYQRDLEEEFRIRRPTVSALLGKMERNGYIVRESVPQDARLKKIVLTDKAKALHEKFVSRIAIVEAEISSGISDEELTSFRTVLDKIRANITK